MNLTPEQQAAVDLVAGPASPRLVALTGGPGTGKTHAIRTLCQELTRQGRPFALAAPSGKAAQRLAEATQRPAATLHRLLRLRPGSDGLAGVLRPEALTEPEVLVVDEASMVDAHLMAATVRACRRHAGSRVRTLLLVGDADQLPPVGPGRPFHDMIEHGASIGVPVVRLTTVQRQAESSGIVRAAHSVRRGEVPTWSQDCRLVTVEAAEEVAPAIWRLCEELRLDPARSQILAAQRNHECGVDALNAYVEARRGELPDVREREAEIDTSFREVQPPLLRDKFRLGTKVMQLRNNYDLGKAGVFNGEMGFVVECQRGVERKRRANGHEEDVVTPARDRLVVELSGGRGERGEVVTYTGATIGELTPCWATTVHKSQGSEWDAVIVVAHPSHSFTLTRSLLYVALTRARELCVVVGTQAAVARAVHKVADTRRQTWLGELAAQWATRGEAS